MTVVDSAYNDNDDNDTISNENDHDNYDVMPAMYR